MNFKVTPSRLKFLVGLLLIGHSFALPVGSQAAPDRNPGSEEASRAGTASGYSSLAGLVMQVCEAAAATFRGFYTDSLVSVQPFVYLNGGTSRYSQLGVSLADQMAAALNHDAHTAFSPGLATDQELSGLLQEMDGYLRIHISGTNSEGERRSHVVAVEMSEPLYRALHTGSLTR